MKKELILTICCLALTATARDLAVLISKTNWQAIPTAKKQQAKAILSNCTEAPIPIKLTWGLRSKANTNQVWDYALYSQDAWVLKQKEKIDAAKLTQIKSILTGYGFYIEWTTNFWAEVDAAGLERIPINYDAIGGE